MPILEATSKAISRSSSFLARPVLAMAGILACLAPAAAAAPVSQKAGLEIQDFSYVDTSGEPESRDAEHRVKLEAFMAALRGDLAADDRYRLAPSSCIRQCSDEAVTPDRLRAASDAGTSILIEGGIHKTSTLVQWAKVRLIDVGAHRVLFERLYTFRGDNDEAWRRAEIFLSREIRETLASAPPASQAAAADPIKLAVFAFELEDTSAAAPSTGAPAVDPVDAGELARMTAAVRQTMAQSPRYRIVDVDGTDADAVRAHGLHDCDGCDAGIARDLGADQSLVGVVRRVSRTEYTIRFQVRDARTGALVAGADSGLRMGANYSWSRGVVRLVSDRLLGTPPQK